MHGDPAHRDEQRRAAAEDGRDRDDRAAQRRGRHTDDEHRPPGLQHQSLRDDTVPPVDRVAEGTVDGGEDAGVGREHGVEGCHQSFPRLPWRIAELRRDAGRQG
ncbi:hypothetical protein [Microbacterium sp. NPDC078849]|uniref:hypothetical protein n=1 Tax=Microbacterium sp. NPDC078849 TaxID=3154860 RepID=UPI0034508CA3